jgi:predicted MFS family arabinose efflux permease
MTQPARTNWYSWYVLFVLLIVNAFNSVDRAMVSILVESIRGEFGFNDLELGILSGLGFAIFYAALGIPIARWADSGNRRNILTIGIAVWSAMTALTGKATGFGTFLLARAGVGIGEATCYPTAYPLISDYFPRALRPIAMALFQMGLFVGIVAGNIIAAKIAAAHGWRTAFAAMGLPGLGLALIVWATVHEPVRGLRDEQAPAPAAPARFGEVLRAAWGDRRFLLVMLATTLLTLASATLGNWGPAFMMRVHGISQADVGAVAAPIGLGGIVGTIGGGIIGSVLAKRSTLFRAPLLVPLSFTLVAVPAVIVFLFAPSMPLVVAFGAIAACAIAAHTGPVIATAVSLVRAELRGTASAVIVIGHLLIGFGMGPPLVGWISDMLKASLGADALRYAMLMAPVCVAIGWVALLAGFRAIGRVTPQEISSTANS